MTPLETRLTNALAADVARFDALDNGHATPQRDLNETEDDLLPLQLVNGQSTRRRKRAMAGVAAAVMMCVTIAAIATRRDGDGSESEPVSESTSIPSASPAIVQSPGVEQPLVETATGAVPGVAKPGSAHAFSVPGHPDLLIWTTLESNPVTGEVEEWQCVSEAGSSGCGPTSTPGVFGQTSSVDNRVATDDLFTWSNLPADVAVVRYDDGVVQFWQRPVSGLAIFRVDPDHPHPSITAFDATGAALPYSFWGESTPDSTSGDTTATVVTETPATGSQMWDELGTLTHSSTHDCLTANGATWPEVNVPAFNADTDSLAIWNTCVIEVKAIVAARLTELNESP